MRFPVWFDLSAARQFGWIESQFGSDPAGIIFVILLLAAVSGAAAGHFLLTGGRR